MNLMLLRDTETNRQLNGPVLALTITPTVKSFTPKLRILFEHSLVGIIIACYIIFLSKITAIYTREVLLIFEHFSKTNQLH